MKKQMKKLEISKETLRILEAVTAGGGEDTVAPADTITYWPEQCTGGSCIPRNC